MNLLEAFLQDEHLKLKEFSEGYTDSINENKYSFKIKRQDFSFVFSQRQQHTKTTSLRSQIKAFNTSKQMKLQYSQGAMQFFDFPLISFKTEIQPFNQNQHRSYLSIKPIKNWKFFVGLTQQNIIQQAQNLCEFGAQTEIKADSYNSSAQASLCYNQYTEKTFLQLDCDILNKEQSKTNASIKFNLSNQFELAKAVVSSRFQFYGQDLLIGYISDPYWHYYLRGNKSLDDSHMRFRNSWAILSWKYKNNFYLTLINDFFEKEAILSSTVIWKPSNHLKLTHCVTSRYEIQHQVNYQLSENLDLAYGIKIILKDGINSKFIGLGVNVTM